MSFFSVILAATINGGIGFNFKLPWHSKEDLKRFKNITTHVSDENKINATIMGRNTYLSILNYNKLPIGSVALPKRLNIIISTTMISHPNILVYPSLDSALQALAEIKDVEDIFVIGGSTLFNEAFVSPSCERVYLTQVQSDSYECDVFINPDLLSEDNGWYKQSTTQSEQGIHPSLEFILYAREKYVENTETINI